MAEPLTADHVLEYPGGYTRSVGPVIGRFLTGLRDGAIVARAPRRRPRARAADRVRPDDERARSRPRAITGSRSVRAGTRADVHVGRGAAAGQAPAHEAVRVRADPARRRRHRDPAHGRLRIAGRDHASACASRRAGGPSAPATSPTSKRGCRSATARSRDAARRCTCPAEDEQPVTGITSAIRLEYDAQRRAGRRASYLDGLGEGKIIGGRAPSTRRRVRRRHAAPTR